MAPFKSCQNLVLRLLIRSRMDADASGTFTSGDTIVDSAKVDTY